ncbi:MAG TPA: YfhO family protein [Deltaproteobacteria bacterium]|nr:YfhO family protein [Deltaproteobacteria bacterium]
MKSGKKGIGEKGAGRAVKERATRPEVQGGPSRAPNEGSPEGTHPDAVPALPSGAMAFWGRAWPVVLVVTLMLAFFGVKVIPRGDAFIAGIDVRAYFYWFETFTRESIRHGQVPLWNPHYYCGHPFLANPQTFVFYPSTLLFVTLPLPWAFNLDVVLHVLVASLGAYALTMRLTSNGAAAAFSALSYGMCGYFMDKIYAGHLTMIHTAALIPWVLLALEKALDSGRWRHYALAGLVFGIQILGGEPQNSFYTLFFTAVYVVVRGFPGVRKSSARPALGLAARFAAFMAVAFSVAAVQVIPSVEFLGLCDRAEKSYTFATGFSYPPQCLFTFLVPKPQLTPIEWGEAHIPFRQLILSWELSGYLGVAGVVLAALGAAMSRGRKGRAALLAVMGLSLVVMLGSYTPLYRVLYGLVPGFATFRIPSRAVVFLVLTLAVFAGMGVDSLMDRTRSRTAGAVVTGAWAVILVLLVAGSLVFTVPILSRQVLVSFAFLCAACGLCVWTLRSGWKAPVYGLVLLVFVDLASTYASAIPLHREKTLLEPNEIERFLAQDKDFTPHAFRVAYPANLDVEYSPLRGMAKGYQNLNGYNPIVLRDFYRFVHDMAAVPLMTVTRHTLALGVFLGDRVFSSRILGVKYAVCLEENGGILAKEAPVYQPRAVLVHDVVYAGGRDEALAHLKDPRFDPARSVVLEEKDRLIAGVPDAPAKGGQGASGATVVRYEPQRIEVRTQSPTNSLLILSELFYPGWRAYVDGREAPVVKADLILRGVPVPAGSHVVSMVYRPLSFYAGLAVSMAALVVLAALYLGRKVLSAAAADRHRA